VTFNYDRSLEVFLSNAYQSLLNLPDAEIHNRVHEDVDFIYVHGNVGPVAEIEVKHGRKYGLATREHLEKAASEIRILGRHDGSKNSFDRARQMIASSEIVVFLGFGFLAENIDGLNLPSLLKGKIVFASAKGLSVGRKTYLDAKIGADFAFTGEDDGCSEFLRKTDILTWAGSRNPDLRLAAAPFLITRDERTRRARTLG
jgi:hypothetical protein